MGGLVGTFGGIGAIGGTGYTGGRGLRGGNIRRCSGLGRRRDLGKWVRGASGTHRRDLSEGCQCHARDNSGKGYSSFHIPLFSNRTA